jgi:hypothetical protein
MELNFEEDIKKFEVIYKGELVHYISPLLAKQQNLSDENLEILKELHVKRLGLFERITEAVKSFPEIVPNLMIEYTAGEFEMQDVWRFPQDENFHRFWDIPACTCPRMDNDDLVGSSHSVIDGACPLHGDK